MSSQSTRNGAGSLFRDGHYISLQTMVYFYINSNKADWKWKIGVQLKDIFLEKKYKELQMVEKKIPGDRNFDGRCSSQFVV